MALRDPDTVTIARPGVGRRTRALLFFGFAFAVMADPVSSVAYAIEAALRALHGHLGLLLPTMGIVIGIIGLVTLNYWQLVRAFPEGGGSPEAAGFTGGGCGRDVPAALRRSSERQRQTIRWRATYQLRCRSTRAYDLPW